MTNIEFRFIKYELGVHAGEFSTMPLSPQPVLNGCFLTVVCHIYHTVIKTTIMA